MKLIVGLGNPGERYAGNRHNIGFMAAEAIAGRHRFGPWKRKFSALAADGEIAGERCLILKPDTYMNESGRAVGEACRFLKIGEADVVVLHDELDLAPGKLKVKSGGGNAGHNGLRSISAHLGNDYRRVRIGIGHPGSRDQVSNFVLSDFAKTEQSAWVEPLLAAMADEAHLLVGDKDDRYVSAVLRRLGPEAETPSADAGNTHGAVPRGEESTKPAKPAPPPARHPAGERAGKRQSAIAENLARWLAARKSGD